MGSLGWKRKTIILALAVGCTRATRPESPQGTWMLVAVDGTVLPAHVTSNIEVISGTLELSADGSYSEITESRAASIVLRSQLRGAWRWSGGTVELLDRQAGLPFVGHWSGSNLEVTGERAMRYAR